MSASGPDRSHLRLVQPRPDEVVEWTWFCGRCGRRPANDLIPAPSARVCAACGFGILLETRVDAAPVAGDAFVIVDSALRVQAMSAAAERLLATAEDLAVNRAIGGLLVQADAERASSRIGDLVAGALSGEPPATAFVRPWNTYGVRLRASIAKCGPPPGALILLG